MKVNLNEREDTVYREISINKFNVLNELKDIVYIINQQAASFDSSQILLKSIFHEGSFVYFHPCV